MKRKNKLVIMLNDAELVKITQLANNDCRKIQDELRFFINTFYERNFKIREKIRDEQKENDTLNKLFDKLIKIAENKNGNTKHD